MKVKNLKKGDTIKTGITFLEIQYVDIPNKIVRVINPATHKHMILPESSIRHMRKSK